MSRTRQQTTGVALVVVAALVAVALVFIAQAWGSTRVLDIPEATRYGNQTFTAPTGHEGQTCRFVVTQTNNRSLHNNTMTLVTNSMTILDVPVERADSPPSWTTPWVTAGETVTLNLWAEDVSSTGFTVDIECEVPPSTTTAETTTTTTSGSSTTSIHPDTTVTTAPTETTTSTTATTVPLVTTTSSSIPTLTTVPSSIPTTTTKPPTPNGVPTGEG